ncbi:MAG: MogA/MoaB family molybdenum cofactor biosynthesis protein [Dehalococcoidia bacterium]
MARIAILTVSDSGAAGGREDASGDTAERRCIEAGHTVAARAIVADEREIIAAQLREWADSGIADWVVTTGGTGLTERDVTPEATRDVAERDVPGVPVALWVNGLKQTPFAVLSRGVAVQRKRTVIVNLPGNPKAVAEGMDVLLPLFPHAARLMAGPLEHTTPADSGRA